MKFKQFLTEKKDDIPMHEKVLEKIKEGAKMVARDCKPFLKEYPIIKTYSGYSFKGNRALYRGYKGKIDVFKKVTPRGDRRPVDIPVDIHNRLDVLFKKKFGWKVRSEGVFVTGSYMTASCYGDAAYIIFPIGKYKHVWSAKIYDMWEELKTTHRLVVGEPGGKKQSLYTPGLTTHEKSLKDIVNSFTDKNLEKGIEVGNEITLKVGSYYLINRCNIDTFLEELSKLI